MPSLNLARNLATLRGLRLSSDWFLGMGISIAVLLVVTLPMMVSQLPANAYVRSYDSLSAPVYALWKGLEADGLPEIPAGSVLEVRRVLDSETVEAIMNGNRLTLPLSAMEFVGLVSVEEGTYSFEGEVSDDRLILGSIRDATPLKGVVAQVTQLYPSWVQISLDGRNLWILANKISTLQGTVTNPTLYERPSNKAAKLQTQLTDGSKVQVLGQKADYYLVDTGEGHGWIPRVAVQLDGEGKP